MSDYESTSPTQTRPTDLDSDKTSGPTVVESVVGVASASPPLLRSEQARQKRRGSLSHLRRGLIAAAALIGSVTGLYIGLGTSPSASAAESVANTAGRVASVDGASTSAAGGSSGTARECVQVKLHPVERHLDGPCGPGGHS